MDDEGKKSPKPLDKKALVIAGGVIALWAIMYAITAIPEPKEKSAFDDFPESSGTTIDVTERDANGDPVPFMRNRDGKGCLSEVDGSNRDLVDKVRQQMRNPGSFEHIETKIYGYDKGEHGLWMTFRAENGFGGINVERIYARIDHETCTALRFGDGPGI